MLKWTTLATIDHVKALWDEPDHKLGRFELVPPIKKLPLRVFGKNENVIRECIPQIGMEHVVPELCRNSERMKRGAMQISIAAHMRNSTITLLRPDEVIPFDEDISVATSKLPIRISADLLATTSLNVNDAFLRYAFADREAEILLYIDQMNGEENKMARHLLERQLCFVRKISKKLTGTSSFL